MKVLLQKIIFLIIVIVISSCSTEELSDENVMLNEAEQKLEMTGDYRKSTPMGAALVSNQTQQCSVEYKPVYTIYAYGGGLANFDRRVEVWVLKDQSIFDYYILNIPAGQNVSSNVPAFRDTYYEAIGEVELRIVSVKNGSTDITSNYNLHSNRPTVDNCVSSLPPTGPSIIDDAHVCNGAGCSHYENP